MTPPAEGACPWDGFTPGTIRFCEERLCGWVAEPANAWSNVGFVLVGLYLLRRARLQGRRPLILVGITSILVGLGSFLFHATGTFFGEYVDLSTMFFIGSLMVTMEARRFRDMGASTLAAVFLGMIAFSMLVLLLFRKTGLVLFGIQVALVYASNIYWKTRRAAADHRHAFWLGGTFAVAFGVWVLDLRGVACAPTNHWFTGHSVWHLMSAACLYFFYRHQEQFVARTALAA